MYTPTFNVIHESELRPLVEAVGSAELITVGEDGFPLATRLPVLWHGDRLVFHMALANPHWRGIEDGARALAVVTGPEAYVSPAWYAAKATHGRVVPTWNYSAVHFTGHATVHRSPDWLLDAVTDLTDEHERRRTTPWSVTDAPETFVRQQLKGIVGIELIIDTVEGKAKRSQNKSSEDRATVVEALREHGGGREAAMADQMQRDLGGAAGYAVARTRPR